MVELHRCFSSFYLSTTYSIDVCFKPNALKFFLPVRKKNQLHYNLILEDYKDFLKRTTIAKYREYVAKKILDKFIIRNDSDMRLIFGPMF